MGEWPRIGLADLFEIRSGLSKKADQFGQGYPFLSFKDVFNNYFVPEQLKQLVMTSEKEQEAFSVRRGDVFLTRTSETVDELGMSCVALRDYPKATFNGFTKRLRPKKAEKLYPEFVGFYLRSPDFRQEILAFSNLMSTRASLNNEMISRLKIPLPPLPEQRAIAAVLSALDDKIALNRRMNETLEGLARALFKDWFVDFGPTRAKASGAKPDLPPETLSLFPDRLDDNGLPEGWEMGTLADIAQSPRRGVKPADVAEDTPYIGLEHMPRRSIALSDWDGAGKVSSNKSRFRKGEFLFGKLRPYFHKVGVTAVDGICSTDIVVVTPKAEEWAALTLACISSDNFVEYTNAGSTGTKMPRTSWKIMGAYEMCIPPRELAQAYQTLVGPMIEKIIENIHQSRTLAQTRDLLLPKLMSGALRVGAAEKIVEGAL